MGTSHLVQVRSRWDHSHKIQVRRRWQQDSPNPGVPQVKYRVIRSGWDTDSEQCNDILMLLRWVPETPGPGEAQVEPETLGPGEVPMGTTVIRSGEAMLRIRVSSYR